jgi:hypothetical protein
MGFEYLNMRFLEPGQKEVWNRLAQAIRLKGSAPLFREREDH